MAISDRLAVQVTFRCSGSSLAKCGLAPRMPCVHDELQVEVGHQQSTWYNVTMPPRKTPADYHALAEKRGFRWLGPEVPNVRTKTAWECAQGHRWSAIYNSIQRGSGCPFCAGRAPKTRADYHALAEERGFQWLGPEVSRVIIKTGWRCEEGHEWEASYNGIQQGKGCPFCARVVPKTPADYEALAHKRGLHWIGPNVPNTATKTVWQCADGHQWEATYNNIQQGKGCPYCAGNVQKSPEDYHALAEERGFRWLGPEVLNTQSRTTWECEAGHQWEAIYNSIQRGTGCPICAGYMQKTPTDYHMLAAERGFRWLGPEVPNVKTNTRWECGEGHTWEAIYDNIARGRGCPLCAVNLQKMPEDYHALAQERGFSWLGPEVPNVKTNTWWECEHGHRWENPYVYLDSGSGCPVCADSVPKTPADYHALAQRRGYRWLGPTVSSIAIRTRWECDEGHRWEAPYYKMRSGWGCPACDERLPKAPEDYHALAEERGFRWLGPEVPNVNTSTSWECEHGHQWETPYGNIRDGTGCPVCAGKEPKTPAEFHALAQERGFRWLGPEVTTVTAKTVWECGEGHQWEAHFHNIRNGRGCPFCAGKAPKTPDDYRALAQERGFLWLGPEVSNVSINTGWRCEEGHEWQATYNRIQGGTGCPFCAGVAPKTPADYYALAEERGFQWLGPEVPTTRAKTFWKCENGHEWEAVYHNIQRGSGCPACLDLVRGSQVSNVQRELAEMLGGELNRPFRRYNIDVALFRSGVPIAVEYDAWYWHGGREEEDARRDGDMIAAGWRVLRVRSGKQLPTRQQLDAAIDRLLGGEQRVEIVLDDWGVGPTRFEVE